LGVLVAQSQNGGDLYKANCAACHTIGSGRLVGPDLIGVTEKYDKPWLKQFIKSSTNLIKAGDSQAVKIFTEYANMPMPDTKLSDAEIDAIIGFIGGGKATGIVTNPVKKVSQENINNGAEYFNGSKSFQNGGSSCISCHNIIDSRVMAGGLLAKDLSQSFRALKYAGISGILSSPPFPVMAEAYKNHSLTESEVFDVTAFLENATNQQETRFYGSFGNPFLTYTILSFLILYGFLGFVWSVSKTRSTNRDIINRQKKSI
jgi:mono/diheme cytochrome c family protein